MRRGARRLRHLALIGAVLGWAALPATRGARAHGPAPAALEGLAWEGGAPTWVRTNVGLAHARDDGSYEYVCPSRWDGNERARAAVIGGGVYVHSAGVAYRALDGCAFEAFTPAEDYVLDLVDVAGRALVVAEPRAADDEPDRSRVRLEGSTVDVTSGAVDGALGGADHGWVAGHAPRPFVGRVGADGGYEEVARFDARVASRWVPRAEDGDAVWILETVGAEQRLLRISTDGLEEGPAHEVVHGPARVDGSWTAILDGALATFEAGAWTNGATSDWTCLRPAADVGAEACAFDALVAVGTSPPETRFSISQLAEPRGCDGGEPEPECARDWAHFGGEAGWLETRPAEAPGAPRRPPAGCAVSRGR